MGIEETLKRQAINKIIADVKGLTAAELEIVGHGLISILENQNLIHRGLNKEGKPVGYTVDSFSDNRQIVGEFSTESKYFDTPFNKLEKDVNHAKKEAPKLTTLYLISNQECPNSKWEDVSSTVQRQLEHDGFHIYDSRRFAETIYSEVVKKSEKIEFFADFLPSLSDIANEYVFSNKVPRLPDSYIEDKPATDGLLSCIKNNSIVVVHGISGCGKTCSVIDYTWRHKDLFDNIIWINGDDLQDNNQFSYIIIERLGHKINIESQFNRGRCLLVIDGLEKSIGRGFFSCFKDGIKKHSKIVVTSQAAPQGDIHAYAFPKLSFESAQKILTFDCQDALPAKEHISLILSKSGNHPLVLTLIRNGILEQDFTWDDIVADLDQITQLDDGTHSIVIDRVFNKHSDGLSNELQRLKWLGTKVFDGSFLRKFIGVAGTRSLRLRSIIERHAGLDLFRVHDLIYSCLQNYEGGNLSEERIYNDFWDALWNDCRLNSYHFQRAIHIHKDMIETYAEKNEVHPNFHFYLYLLVEGKKNDQILKKLLQFNIKGQNEHWENCHCIIEAYETIRFQEQDTDKRVQYDRELINKINAALESVSDETLKSDLLHHKAKALRRLKNTEDAFTVFQDALALNPKALHTALQIGRIAIELCRNRKDERLLRTGEEALKRILTSATENIEESPVTVVLAAVSLLPQYKKMASNYFRQDDNIEFIRRIIERSLVEGFSQPYEAFVPFARNTWYEKPDIVLSLAENMIFPDIKHCDYWSSFNVAETHKNIGKAYFAKEQNEKGVEWCKQAIPYYERRLSLSQNKNEYELRMTGECYVRAEMYDEALSILKQIPSEQENSHSLHRKAEALSLIGKHKEALKEIDKAISLNQDDKYIATFLAEKSEILQAQGKISEAKEVLKSAIEELSHGKYRDALKKKLSLLTGEGKPNKN